MNTIKKSLAALALAGSALLPRGAEAQTNACRVDTPACAQENARIDYVRGPASPVDAFWINGTDTTKAGVVAIPRSGPYANRLDNASVSPAVIQNGSKVVGMPDHGKLALALPPGYRVSARQGSGITVSHERSGNTAFAVIDLPSAYRTLGGDGKTPVMLPFVVENRSGTCASPCGSYVAWVPVGGERSESVVTTGRHDHDNRSDRNHDHHGRGRGTGNETRPPRDTGNGARTQARSQLTVGAGYLTQTSESTVPRGLFTVNVHGPSAYALLTKQPGENGMLLVARGMAVNASGDHGEQGGLRERTALTTNYLEAEGILAKKTGGAYLLGGRGSFEGATTTELASSTNTTIQGRARSTNGRVTAQGLVGYDRNGVRLTAAFGPRIRDDAHRGTNPQYVTTLEAAREGLGPLDARVKVEHVQNGDAFVTGTTANLNYRARNGLGVGTQVTWSNQRTLSETTKNTVFSIYGTYTLGGRRR